MKRLLSMILALVLLFSLTACGGEETPKTPDTSDTPGAGPKDPVQQQTPSGDTEKEADFTVPETDPANRTTDLKITTLKLNKKIYAPGEAIAVTLKWTGTPDDSAWVGIIPAGIPHGDETANDDADVAYIYLSSNEGDQFVFDEELAEDLAPGMYTIRVNENDGGGAELAWCAFAVAGAAKTESPADAPATGEIVDFAVGIEGVPSEWQKAIGEGLFGAEVSGDGSDFTTGYLHKFGNITSEDYVAYKAYFDSLEFDFEADGIYNCAWGQFQLSHNSEYGEITVTWYVK